MAQSKKLATGFIELAVKSDKLDKGLQQATNKTKSSLGEVRKSLAGLAQTYAGASMLGFFFKMAARAELFESKIRSLSGSAEEANYILQEVNEYKFKSPFPTEQIQTAAIKLKAAQVAAGDIVPTLKAVSNIAAATGAELEGINLAYTQVLQKGRLQGEELLQFAERGIPVREVLKEIIEEQGRSAGEFASMMERGEISASMVTDALMRLGGESGKYGDAINNLLKTSRGQLMLLNKNWEAASEIIGQTLLPIVNSLASSLNSLLEQFKQLDDGTRRWIGNIIMAVSAVIALQGAFSVLGLGSLIGSVGTLSLKFVGLGDSIFRAAFAVMKLPVAFTRAILSGQILTGVLTGVKMAVRGIGTAIKFAMAATGIGLLITMFGTLIAYLMQGVDWTKSFTDFWYKLQGPIAKVQVAFETAWVAIESIVISIWNFIQEMFNGWFGSSQKMADDFLEVVVQMADAIANFVIKSVAWAKALYNHLGEVWEGIKQAAIYAFLGMGNAITTVWKEVTLGASQVLADIMSWIPGMKKTAANMTRINREAYAQMNRDNEEFAKKQQARREAMNQSFGKVGDEARKYEEEMQRKSMDRMHKRRMDMSKKAKKEDKKQPPPDKGKIDDTRTKKQKVEMSFGFTGLKDLNKEIQEFYLKKDLEGQDIQGAILTVQEAQTVILQDQLTQQQKMVEAQKKGGGVAG